MPFKLQTSQSRTCGATISIGFHTPRPLSPYPNHPRADLTYLRATSILHSLLKLLKLVNPKKTSYPALHILTHKNHNKYSCLRILYPLPWPPDWLWPFHCMVLHGVEFFTPWEMWVTNYLLMAIISRSVGLTIGDIKIYVLIIPNYFQNNF